MRRWIFSVALALMGSSARAVDAPAQCRADAPDVRQIRAVAIGIVEADNRRDLERVIAYYAADATLLPPFEGAVTGREAIRPRYEALFAAFSPEIEGHLEEACTAGGLGFVRGWNGGRMVPRSAGDVRALDDAYLMLLRLEPDGAWRVSHLMWHRRSASSPPKPTR